MGTGADLTAFTVKKTASVASVYPYQPNTLSLGTVGNYWKDLFIGGAIKSGSNSNYGLALPSTSGWTANKTIATTDQCGTKLYKHKIKFDNNGSTNYLEFISLNPTPINDSHALECRLTEIISIFSSDNSGKALYIFSDGVATWWLKQQDAYYEDLMTSTLGEFVSYTDEVTPL